MKTNVPIRKQRVEAKSKPADIQRLLSAGWLRLLRTQSVLICEHFVNCSKGCKPRIYRLFLIALPSGCEFLQLCKGQWHKATGQEQKARYENETTDH